MTTRAQHCYIRLHDLGEKATTTPSKAPNIQGLCKTVYGKQDHVIYSQFVATFWQPSTVDGYVIGVRHLGYVLNCDGYMITLETNLGF